MFEKILGLIFGVLMPFRSGATETRLDGALLNVPVQILYVKS